MLVMFPTGYRPLGEGVHQEYYNFYYRRESLHYTILLVGVTRSAW